MSARDLLDRASATGVKILADNGELVLRGDESAIAALVPEAQAHKAELLDELTKPGIVTANEPLPDPQAEARYSDHTDANRADCRPLDDELVIGNRRFFRYNLFGILWNSCPAVASARLRFADWTKKRRRNLPF